MGFFERYLSLCVGLCILAGMALGQAMPGFFQSGAALATVVGVLIEVPVMLAMVAIVNRSQGWYERGMTPRVP